MKWIWEDYDEMGRHYKCSECGYKIMVHERMGKWVPPECPNCEEIRDPEELDMKQYVVTEYEVSDFDEARDNMTRQEAISILESLPRGYFSYRHPSYGSEDVNDYDYEKYKICCALDMAIEALLDGN